MGTSSGPKIPGEEFTHRLYIFGFISFVVATLGGGSFVALVEISQLRVGSRVIEASFSIVAGYFVTKIVFGTLKEDIYDTKESILDPGKLVAEEDRPNLGILYLFSGLFFSCYYILFRQVSSEIEIDSLYWMVRLALVEISLITAAVAALGAFTSLFALLNRTYLKSYNMPPWF